MVVDRIGFVTVGFQVVGQRFAGFFLQNRFVGVLADAKIIDVHAGEHLKL